jgi:formamidase
MARLLTVLAAQARPVAFDPGATLDRFERQVRMAAKTFPEVDLIVYPELHLTGDDPFVGEEPPGFASRVAEPVPGPTSERVAGLAAEVNRWIVAGSIFERSQGRIHNTALVVSPDGDLVGVYRKLFPWRPFERTVPGEKLTLFDIPEVGRVGLMICYDGWFPETARALALEGAELIIQLSLTATADREQELVLARAAAIANQIPVISVNAASSIGGGHSLGVDPEGRVLFEGGGGEELIVEVLDLDRMHHVRERGTRGLNRVWDHLQEAPPAVLEPYRRFLDRR